MDVDRTSAVEPAKSMFALKAQVRRAVEAAGIPYTYVSSNNFAGYFLPSFSQPGATTPPRDKVVILGDGNAKGNNSPYYIMSPLIFFPSFFLLMKNRSEISKLVIIKYLNSLIMHSIT